MAQAHSVNSFTARDLKRREGKDALALRNQLLLAEKAAANTAAAAEESQRSCERALQEKDIKIRRLQLALKAKDRPPCESGRR